MFKPLNTADSCRPLTRGEILRKRRVYEPVHLTFDATSRPVAYEVLRAGITKVRYCRDFGRIEACVAVTYAYHPSAPPQTDFLLVNVPLHKGGQPQDLRRRLVQRAVCLSVRFNHQQRETTLKAA